jgi:hypothetical protein
MQNVIAFGRKVAPLLILVVLPLAAIGAPAGKYRQEIRNPFRGSDYTLVRTLNLFADGRAELYTEYRGDRPDVDGAVRDALGDLMRNLRDVKKIKHAGNWHVSRNRVQVELSRLDAGDDDRNVASDFEFERIDDELIARRQDSTDYGDRSLRLRMIQDWGRGPEEDDFDVKRHRGKYGWGTELKGEDGESFYIRRLELNTDRSAYLISEYSGKRPRLNKETTDDFGILFAEVVANKKITHRGKWAEENGRIRVDLTRVGGGDFAQNVSSSFVFDPRGDELILVEGDRSDYGSVSFRMRKDWSPGRLGDFPDEPKPSFGHRTYTELDISADGGGMLSHEGTKAREFDRARLILRKDGRFELRLQGDGSETFRGHYDLDRNNNVTLDAREAFGGSAAGSGEVNLNGRGGIGKIILRGDARGRRFTLNFTGR